MSLSDFLREIAGYSEARPLRRHERHGLEQAAQRLLDLEAQLERASDSADTLAKSLRAVERRLATERHNHANARQALVLYEQAGAEETVALYEAVVASVRSPIGTGSPEFAARVKAAELAAARARASQPGMGMTAGALDRLAADVDASGAGGAP